MNIQTERVHESLRRRTERSLCTSCDAAAICGHRVRARGPVWACEEYDPGRGRSIEPAQGSLVEDGEAAAGQDSAAEATGLRGLCVNCDERRSCPHARSESGVWHCEDYR